MSELNKVEVSIKRYENIYYGPVKALIIRNDMECNSKTLPMLSFVADIEGKIIGYIGGSVSYGECGHVHLIVVDKFARRIGIGSTLLKCLLKEFKENGINKVSATVDYDNKGAIKMYKALGIEMNRCFLLESPTEELLDRLT
jgi:ribosomal protein S18 acetylase RimI-like enzyme